MGLSGAEKHVGLSASSWTNARQRYYQKKGIFLPLLLHDMLNTERPSHFLYLLNPQNFRGHVLAACPLDTSMKLVTSAVGWALAFPFLLEFGARE